MPSISHPFEYNDAVDIIWTICLFTGIGLMVIAFCSFARIILHLHCIPNPDANSEIAPVHTKVYSTISATFATLNVLVGFSAYVICAELSCWANGLQWAFTILFWDSYIMSKILLYLIFIDRLFNPYYRQIYQYPKITQYFLKILLIILTVVMLEITLDYALLSAGIPYPDSIDIISTAVYLITDFIMSVSTVILFFRPICCRYPRNSNSVSLNSSDVDMSVVKKYGIISALQLIAAVSYQAMIVFNIYLSVTKAATRVQMGFSDISSLIRMLDGLLVMICIEFGFTRKQTVCVLYHFPLIK